MSNPNSNEPETEEDRTDDDGDPPEPEVSPRVEDSSSTQSPGDAEEIAEREVDDETIADPPLGTEHSISDDSVPEADEVATASEIVDNTDAESEETGKISSIEQREEQNTVFENVEGDDKVGEERKKWFFFAVGGCGNNLLDAIYMRKKTLEEDEDPREIIWRGGIEGVVNTNTNNKEIKRSFHANKISKAKPEDYANSYGFPGGGAGQDEKKGDHLAQKGFQNGLGDEWGASPNRADGIMLLHSAVKGTGSGATPRIARRLNTDLRDRMESGKELPIYSCVVLPDRVEGLQGDYTFDSEKQEVTVNNRNVENAMVCLGRLAGEANVIIPFQNRSLVNSTGTSQNLSTLPRANLGDHKPVNFQEYYEHNQTLVSYLETFSMTAVPKDESEVGFEIEGAGSFDVIDPYQPAESLNPNDYTEENRPAMVFAPAHTRSSREKFESQSTIDQLLNNLITQRLSVFEPETAWGCSILFYGSKSAIDSLSNAGGYITQTMSELCNGNESGFRDFNVMDYYLTIPEMDEVRVWAGFWNPKMQMIDDCKAFVENRADDKPRVDEFKQEFNRLYDNLGREAFQ